VGQKFTYTQLVFGSIAFKLFNLGQTFRVAFHKLPTINLETFGKILLTELVYGEQMYYWHISEHEGREGLTFTLHPQRGGISIETEGDTLPLFSAERNHKTHVLIRRIV
jgi:hypothetical protein